MVALGWKHLVSTISNIDVEGLIDVFFGLDCNADSDALLFTCQEIVSAPVHRAKYQAKKIDEHNGASTACH
jgi:hypothetical protein